MSYDATHAGRLKDVKTLGKTINDTVNASNAGAHNAIYRGNNLGSTLTDALSSAIRAGRFAGTYDGVYADIYPGDYLSFSNVAYTYLDENDVQQSDTYTGIMRAADMDYFYKCGDSGDGLSSHHVVFVPDEPMFNAPMNDTGTTEGGYVNSKMRTVYLRRAEAIFKACFGEDHVRNHREYLVNAVTNGKSSGSAWFSSYVELMDERMIYGSLIFESGETHGKNSLSCKQLNLFRHRPDLIANRQYFWLRNIASATNFCRVQAGGYSDSVSANNAGQGVRPYALIY